MPLNQVPTHAQIRTISHQLNVCDRATKCRDPPMSVSKCVFQTIMPEIASKTKRYQTSSTAALLCPPVHRQLPLDLCVQQDRPRLVPFGLGCCWPKLATQMS